MRSTFQCDVRAFANNDITRAEGVVDVRWNCIEDEIARRRRKLIKTRTKELMKISLNNSIVEVDLSGGLEENKKKSL